jgi:acyl carrier protein
MTIDKKIEDQLLLFIKKKLQITDDDILRKTIVELGVDSLTILELSMSLEVEFNLRIDLDKLSSDLKIIDMIHLLIKT